MNRHIPIWTFARTRGKIALDGFKMDLRWPKMAPRCFKRALRWPRMAPIWHQEWLQRGPRNSMLIGIRVRMYI